MFLQDKPMCAVSVFMTGNINVKLMETQYSPSSFIYCNRRNFREFYEFWLFSRNLLKTMIRENLSRECYFRVKKIKIQTSLSMFYFSKKSRSKEAKTPCCLC